MNICQGLPKPKTIFVELQWSVSKVFKVSFWKQKEYSLSWSSLHIAHYSKSWSCYFYTQLTFRKSRHGEIKCLSQDCRARKSPGQNSHSQFAYRYSALLSKLCWSILLLVLLLLLVFFSYWGIVTPGPLFNYTFKKPLILIPSLGLSPFNCYLFIRDFLRAGLVANNFRDCPNSSEI